ncbi:hypothetical protein LTR91_012132 [Friedmanniomyces endolithicus]|uniref:Sequence orphan n=2 Tax=Friedmanniomyces endolithicus TaxID=329885 RepID=A0AAN6FWL3_9PEZI|nr:hypothetical protein LTS09_005102 [Friedmanniomyces endolithicus]KAK0290452.1 hypothetical protein LTR35_002395 [Friedmanniomyces endolithicus]KAK0295843.1 hypothetical protein LTS00_005584 [Friedmanniomyces endolithicus]KAK0308979.1 hypothetical protein LTR01_004860 [Friedmanniomyces endolithicus]KAK0325814.1 hypothetical protein LTR82_003352 [Friedmanniomyces endolithicus]
MAVGPEEPPAAGRGSVEVSQSAQVHATAPVVDTSPAPKTKVNGVKLAEKERQQWNTRHLGSRMAVDAACAASAGGLVAPLITMIDKAIIENASGKRKMMDSLKASCSTLLLRPHRFLTSKPFALILMLYTGTYLAANTLDTFKSTTNNKAASSTTSGATKFAATSAANLSLCLYKDSQYTKMFGTVSARPVPPVTYALFAARDCLTIFASFNLPPILAPNMPLSESAEKYISRASAAQFLAPAAIQLISTPFHLLGLDLYNRNGGTSFGDRLRKVRVDWLKSSIARMCRIVPAFGFGGVVNNGLRVKLMKGLEA